MPPITPRIWPADKAKLVELGRQRMERFCNTNAIELPALRSVELGDWSWDACAYYRKNGVVICPAKCGYLCGEARSMNWTWPGNTTDREPFGVIAHELGHHCDLLKADTYTGRYFSDYSLKMRPLSGEKPLTSYCPNDAEWFAEMFRLFVTNHALLKVLRPKTWELLRSDWKPVSSDRDWRVELGTNVPARIIENLSKKMR
jgi:hypothetical protein